MIPKQLFFIWFGNNEPRYVKFAINSFKKANPDFKINFLRYTVSQIENREKVSEFDHNVYNCLDYILTKNKDSNFYKRIISYTVKDNHPRKTLQLLANIVRLDLLNEYGGIYLDCDMFPLKPFDDTILNYNSFSCNTFSKSNDKKRRKDCCFLGWNNDVKIYSHQDPEISLDVNESNFLHNKCRYNWWVKRYLFYRCKLKYRKNIDSPYYIEHFLDNTWIYKNKRNRTPVCVYDKLK